MNTPSPSEIPTPRTDAHYAQYFNFNRRDKEHAQTLKRSLIQAQAEVERLKEINAAANKLIGAQADENDKINNALLQSNAALSAQVESIKAACHNLLKSDSPYPLNETANILVEAVQILLNEKGYDGQQHDKFAIARNYATLVPKAVDFVKDALQSTPTTTLAEYMKPWVELLHVVLKVRRFQAHHMNRVIYTQHENELIEKLLSTLPTNEKKD